MTQDTVNPIERDSELTLKELDAVSGGAMVDYFHTANSQLPPGPCNGSHFLNPQPLPPG